MQTQQSTTQAPARKLSLPEGAKLGYVEPISPVLVTRIRTVGFDKQTLEFQLEQIFPTPVGSQSGLLSITMAGHSAFNSGPRKRVTWLNHYTQRAIDLGFIKSWEQVAESKVEIEGVEYAGWYIPEEPIVYRLVDLDGKELNCKIIEVDTYEPRTWKDKNGANQSQRPKTAGNGGDLLTFTGSDGKPKAIYANRILSAEGMDDPKTGRLWNEDMVIVHNNTIVGSSVREQMNKAGIATPTVPGSPAAIAAQIGTQNRRPGYTSNLIRPRPEPTRSVPTAASPEVSEETKAQEAREVGERPVESVPQS